MKTDSKLSRRRLLASVPAVAATMTPVAATALAGLPTGVAGNPDAALLALKPRLDAAIEDYWDRHQDSELGMEAFEAELERRTGLTRGQGWSLDKDSPEFEAWKTARLGLVGDRLIPSRYPDRSDEEVAKDADEFNGLINDILEPSAVTPEGMGLQCRALIMDFAGEWDDGNNIKMMQFVASVMTYLNVKLEFPAGLVLEIFGDDEEETDAA